LASIAATMIRPCKGVSRGYKSRHSVKHAFNQYQTGYVMIYNVNQCVDKGPPAIRRSDQLYVLPKL